MTPRLTHLALAVQDLDATITFYRRHVGLHVVHERDEAGFRVVWLAETPEEPRFVLVLFPASSPRAAGPSTTLQHLGFAVESRAAVDAAAERARAENVLLAEPTYHGPVVGYFCIVRDPDGNCVEFSHGQPIDPRELPHD